MLHFDKAAEDKLRLKIDLYIVPTVALLYLFCFIDRGGETIRLRGFDEIDTSHFDSKHR